MKVLFLISNGFGIGGTIMTTFNLAGGLAARGHDVEVLSTHRHRDVPQIPLDPAVKLIALIETRPDHPDYDGADPLRGKPTRFYPKADYRSHEYDKMAEDRLERFLKTSDADVVIATRAGLLVYVARFAPQRMVRIGQEHLTRRQQRRVMRWQLPRHINKLDAFVTVTARDARDYRKHLILRHTVLTFIPNSVPAPTVPVSDGSARLVVAAGRLAEGKRYDVLIRAFAKVVAERPDWQLRVYGTGKMNQSLRALVVELGLHNHVLMMGPYTPIETEWAKAAIAAVPSDREPFGMTLVEAMRAGVPVVSTDAPYGPAEILADGVDGLLTPVSDPEAMGDALLRLINDRGERERMAAAALKNSERFDPAPIAERYEKLFVRLAARKAGRGTGRWRRLLSPRTPQTPAAPPVLGPAAALTLPTASGEVSLSGDVILRPGPALARDAALVWRRLNAGEPAELPQTGHTVRAGEVPDGNWRLWLRDGAAVHAGALDTRALLALPEEADAVLVQVPYRLSDGGLALRVWHRAVHAEVGDVQVDETGVHFEGMLFGADDAPVIELRSPDGVRTDVGATVEGRRFRASVAPTAPGIWGLWLRSRRTRTRLGRFRDDVVRKNTAYALPATTVAGLTLQPYYEANNEFSVRVTA